MSAMTLKQGIENKIFQDIPDCNGVIQVLWNQLFWYPVFYLS
jgi:Fe-S cluster biogenesis protein NfuA